jgi:hypothetical protein
MSSIARHDGSTHSPVAPPAEQIAGIEKQTEMTLATSTQNR